ncbi:CsbD family protein [Streptomyces sp. NPDC002004]
MTEGGPDSTEELIQVGDQGKKIRGKTQETVGKAKEELGRVTGDEELSLKGTGDRIEGKTKQAAGKTGQTVRGTAEEVKGKAQEVKGKARKNM